MNALPRCAAVLLLILPAARAVDWPHYRGPALNGVTSEKLPATISGEPKRLWKRALGTGVSAATVVGERVFTMGNVGGQDITYCLDAATGKEVWRHKFSLPVDAKNFEGGPRSTPTVEAGKVYTLSHSGDVWCLDAASGRPLWNKHLMQDFKGRRPGWGCSWRGAEMARLLALLLVFYLGFLAQEVMNIPMRQHSKASLALVPIFCSGAK